MGGYGVRIIATRTARRRTIPDRPDSQFRNRLVDVAGGQARHVYGLMAEQNGGMQIDQGAKT
jgi:hypothetical protein